MSTTYANKKTALSADVVRGFLGRVREAAPESASQVATPGFEDIGRRWRELGVREGDLVLLCFPNGKTLLEHFFGALAAGAVPALLAPSALSARLRDLADVMGARAMAAMRVPAGELVLSDWSGSARPRLRSLRNGHSRRPTPARWCC